MNEREQELASELELKALLSRDLRMLCERARDAGTRAAAQRLLEDAEKELAPV